MTLSGRYSETATRTQPKGLRQLKGRSVIRRMPVARLMGNRGADNGRARMNPALERVLHRTSLMSSSSLNHCLFVPMANFIPPREKPRTQRSTSVSRRSVFNEKNFESLGRTITKIRSRTSFETNEPSSRNVPRSSTSFRTARYLNYDFETPGTR